MRDSSTTSPSASPRSDSSGDVNMDANYTADSYQEDGGGGSSSSGNQSDEGQEEEEGEEAMTTAAKFKAAQDLRIQTSDLPPSGMTKARASSVGSDTIASAEAKTPQPPSSTGKKRRRRTAAQIDRKFPCTYPGCAKAYGSEGSLTQHQRLKHRNQSPESALQGSQLTSFFLRTPRGSLAATLAHATTPNGARTVSIRPAGLDTSSLVGLQVFEGAATTGLVPEHEAVSGSYLLSSSSELMGSAFGGTPRQHLRARSNSMPVSYSTSTPPYLTPQSHHPAAPPSSSSSSSSSTTTKQAPRRGRPAGTPRCKPPLRRTKSRSKSESMNELMAPFEFRTDECLRLPANSRSASDSVTFPAFFRSSKAATSYQDYEAARLPFSWANAVAYPETDSPPSSVEDAAIDSDILSVLADCGDDASDTGDSTLELVSSSSSVDKADEWLSQQDALYLTTSLERMTMMHDSSPHPRIKLEGGFPPVEIDSFSIHRLEAEDPVIKTEVKVEVTDHLFPQELYSIKSEDQQRAATASWTKDLAALESYSSAALDQSDYMDVDSSSYMPWKTEKPKAASVSSSSASATTLDPLTAFLQHGEKHTSGFFTIGDSFALDYAMEEPRESSPVVAPCDDL